MESFSTALKLLPLGLGVVAMLVTPRAPAQAPELEDAPVILLGPQFGAMAPGCPVFMRASQRSSARVFEAGGTAPAPAQNLTVTLTGLRALRLTSAEVVVHALSPKNRAVLTSREEDADVTRPFRWVAKDSGEFSEHLRMEGVTAIRWIEVKSLTYSNGSVWRESETRKCIVRPDPCVLISSGR